MLSKEINVDFELERAKKRARVFSKLDATFGSNKGKAIDEQKLEKKETGGRPDFIRKLQEITGDMSEKNERQLLDIVKGKSIVLDNMKHESLNAKSEFRIKKEIKRNKSDLSNGKKKMLGIKKNAVPSTQKDFDLLRF